MATKDRAVRGVVVTSEGVRVALPSRMLWTALSEPCGEGEELQGTNLALEPRRPTPHGTLASSHPSRSRDPAVRNSGL